MSHTPPKKNVDNSGVQHDVYHPLHVLSGPCTEFFDERIDAYNMTWNCYDVFFVGDFF